MTGNVGAAAFVIGAFLSLSACSSPERAWQRATQADTVAGYEAFLRDHPKSGKAPEAKARIEKLHRGDKIAQAMKAGTREALEAILVAHPQEAVVAGARNQLAEVEFQRMTRVDSVGDWNEFLARFPDSSRAGDARRRRDALLLERSPQLRNVKTIRIQVTESYGSAKGVRLPFAADIRALLAHAGIEETTDVRPDAVMTVRASGEPLGARYTPYGKDTSSFLYTGATLAGTVTLAAGDFRMSERFERRMPVEPVLVSYSSRSAESPEDAPFGDAYSQSFARALRILVVRAFGPSPLFGEAFTAGGPRDSWATAFGLASAKNSPFERLKALLDHGSETQIELATRTLGEIGNMQAVAILAEAARKDREVEKLVGYAIRRVATRDPRTLLRGLESTDRTTRLAAIDALGLAKEKRAIRGLVTQTSTGDQETRCRAVEALGRLDVEAALEALVGIMNGGDGDPAVRACAEKELRKKRA